MIKITRMIVVMLILLAVFIGVIFFLRENILAILSALGGRLMVFA